MVIVEKVKAWGHQNIRATHRTTIEITKDAELTPRGDCIIGVKADKSVNDLSVEFKNKLRREGSILIIEIKVSNLMDYVLAEGSPKLSLDDDNKLIIRKSTYIDRATLCIRANKSAADIDRNLIEKLKNPSTVVTLTLIVLEKHELLKFIRENHDSIVMEGLVNVSENIDYL
ncbi:MAG: DUF371 domain-containing protein [Desulfurococcaceae archaeon]